MLSNILLRAKDISKSYLNNKDSISILKHALFKTKIDAKDEFKILDNINLEIYQGETVGIMGRNGAGKTTLLGIFGNVIQPSSGEIDRFAKIATLLGLSAGFNHNFTGRENAYLFCSIQGMDEISAKSVINKIEEFADLDRYFDMPLSTYSSGMQSRLAFSCAINVNAELIIIDETLAVGDANFRMKCYERIRLMKESGQTFLLVSHNPDLVANFCTRGIVLEAGRKIFDGSTFEAVEVYKQLRTDALMIAKNKSTLKTNVSKQTKLEIDQADITLDGLTIIDSPTAKDIGLITGQLIAKKEIENVTVNFSFRNSSGIVVCAYLAEKSGFVIKKIKPKQVVNLEFQFSKRFLPGRYFVTFGINKRVGDVTAPLLLMQNSIYFDIQGDSVMGGIADFGMKVNLIE